MSNLKITVDTLIRPVRDILMNASFGKGHGPQAITSYQIADRLSHLDKVLYKELEEQKGITGPGSMFNIIAKTCLTLADHGEIGISYMDARGVEFEVAGGRINPSYQVIALYRLA